MADKLILVQQGEVSVARFVKIAGVPRTTAYRRRTAMVERDEAVKVKAGEDGNETKGDLYRPAPKQG